MNAGLFQDTKSNVSARMYYKYELNYHSKHLPIANDGNSCTFDPYYCYCLLLYVLCLFCFCVFNVCLFLDLNFIL